MPQSSKYTIVVEECVNLYSSGYFLFLFILKIIIKAPRICNSIKTLQHRHREFIGGLKKGVL
jgi:hypothetical protein